MTEQVLIEFITDTSTLTPAIDLLEKMGQIDAKAAESFKKSNAELEKKNQVSQKVVETTGKQIVSTKELEKSVGKLGDAIEEAISTTVVNGIEEINRRYETLQKRADAAGISVLELAKRQEELKQKLSDNQALGPFQKLASSVSEAEKRVLSLSARLNSLSSKGINDGPLFDRLTKELPKAQAELAKLRGQYDEVTSATQRNKTATNQLDGAQESLKKQLREMKVVISQMILAGDSQSAKFKQLVAEAGALEDAIGDANEEIRRAASDTSGLDRTISAVGAGVGAYTAFAGAAALAGDSNEEFQATMQKLMAVMSIMNGLQSLQTELARHDSLVKKGLTAVQKAWTGAITETNVALRFTKVALMATGIGAFIVLLGVLIENWDSVKDAMSGATEASKAAAKQQEHLNAISEKAADSYMKEATQMESLTRRVKEGGLSFKDKEKVLKDYNDQFGDTIGKAKTFEEAEKKIIETGPKYIEMLTLQAKAHAAFDLAVEASKKAILAQRQTTDDLTSNLDKFKAGFTSLEGFFKGTDSAMEKLAKQRRDKNEKIANDDKDFALNLQKEIQDELNKLSEETGIDLGKKDVEKMKKAGMEEVDIYRLALEEKKALRQKELLAIEKAGQKETQSYIDKQKEIIEVEKQVALHLAKGINQRALIIAEAEQKVADLQKDFVLKQAEERNQLEIANIKNRLAIALEGGKEEQKVKIELLEAEAAQQIKHIEATITNEELRAAKILEVENKLNADRRAIEDEVYKKKANYESEIAELKRAGDIINLQRRLIGEKDKETIANINDQIKRLQLQSIQDEIDLNEALFSRGLKAKEDYERAKVGLANKYAQEQLNIDQKLADDQLKIQQDKEQKEKEIRQQMQAAAFQIAEETAQAIFEIGKSKRDAELQENMDRLNSQKDRELQNKNLTEEQKNAIEERYKKKEAALKTEAAKKDKQAAISQALVNAALAITKALSSAPPPFNFVAAGLVAASTAIQIAKIKSTPIPKFARGTKHAPKGYALVGEEGPEVVYLKGGEKIYTHAESKKLMVGWDAESVMKNIQIPSVEQKVISNSYVNNQGEVFRFDYRKLGKEISKNIPQAGLDVNQDGFYAWMQDGNSKTIFKNRRYKL